MRLEHLLEAHAVRFTDKTALVAGERRVTYGELHAQAKAIAVGLHRFGIGPGDRVLVYLPNGVEFVELMFAILMVGGVVVPVNTRLTAKELAYFASDSRPGVVAIHADYADAIEAVKSELGAVRWILAGGTREGMTSFEELSKPTDVKLPDVPMEAEDCMLMYSSGTTGKPKGAIVTHANYIIQHGYLNAIDWRITSDDVFIVTTPLAHRTGLARMMNSMCLGGTLVVMDRFDPKQAIDLIEREKVTAAGMVPTVARMLLPVLETMPERCASLRHIIVTGEAFPVEVKKKIISLLPNIRLHSFFAMTEVGSVTSLDHEEQFTHPASVGRVSPGVQIKLIDDQGKEVSVGEPGELLVRTGPAGRYTTMRGYYNRPEETAKTIVNGWVHTGDMARLDVDGYLYIVDRKKDMVLSGGFNIYTKEVELALLEHPAVQDVAVVGTPDPIFGEAVVAFIEVKPEHTLTSEEIIEHCRSRIASYKKPKFVHFVPSLPRNPLGKVLKTELRDSAKKMSSEQEVAQ